MDAIQKIIALIESKRKSSFPWTREQPFDQPFYTYSPEKKVWRETKPAASAAVSLGAPAATVTVLSWNIDFMLIHPNDRMTAALKHLSTHVAGTSPAPIILLQEMLVSDLELLQSTPWVQASYNLTDITDRYWESGHYGTVTLVPKALPITRIFRVHYAVTKMERDALFVDVDVGRAGRALRVCNTHLESLVADPPVRPGQLATAAQWMKADSGVLGAVLGGDLNAIQPFDRTLHSDNGLGDAYLAAGGQEDSDESYTWGPMAPTALRQQFGSSRMDKLLFSGAVELASFETFGMGVEVEDEELKKQLIGYGTEAGWVTDHLGVKGVFKIGGGASNL